MRKVRQRVPQLRILPYKMGSKGATVLAEGLRMAGEKCFKVFPDKKYIPRPLHTIINWGSGDAPNWDAGRATMLNHPYYVRGASNKLTAFRAMKEAGVSVPEFTTESDVARDWVHSGEKVVSRYKLQGHSGDGIELSGDYDTFIHRPRPPLYVKYVKKQHEYRVHVFNGNVIDVQMKRKKREVDNEEVDYQVRNHANGWVYCRDGVNPHEDILSNATLSVAALGLDFGAVDVIWNEYKQKAYVLEVNTAPGLEGTTLTKYVEAIKGVM